MFNYKIYGIIALMLCSLCATAQELTGYVYEFHAEEGDKHPLPGANIVWLGTTDGTTSNEDGYFSLPLNDATDKLVVSFIGFKADTIVVDEVKPMEVILTEGAELNTVTVAGHKAPTTISGFTPINSTTLGSDEFKKAACCNLSESFQTNPTVSVSYADGVTGAKEIKMLGLDGSYTQFTIENMPAIRGLGRPFGLNFIPGTWLESIQISKGTGSVANGYESITGQINIELLKPDESPKFFLNLYANHMGRTEGSINLAKRFTPKVSSMLLMYGSIFRTEMDHNNDGFLDAPMNRQANVFNRWMFIVKPNWHMQMGMRALYEDRRGGQTAFDEGRSVYNQPWYAVLLKTQRYEAFMKNGFLLKNGIDRSIGWQQRFVYHKQHGYYGRRPYEGIQRNYYSNLIFETGLGSNMHKLRTGASFNYDHYDESLDTVLNHREEIVPGVFTEYTFSYLSKFSLVAGMRVDYHNLYGLFWSPRLHLRYSPREMTTIRLSAGKGYRVANIFADNTRILVSNRSIIVLEDLNPEEAWNFGSNFTQKFRWKGREAVFNVDYYFTWFINQVVVDLDQDRYQSIFYNLDGTSYSHSIQVDFMYELVKGLDVKLAYKYNDVKVTYNGVLQAQAMVPHHQGHFNVGYTTPNEQWLFDATLQLNGKARLPESYTANELSTNGKYTPVFVLMNLQITKKWKNIDLYAGTENLTGYTQKNPIISADNPFSPDFDAAAIWAPLMPQVAYVGLRLTIQ